jgi:DNA replicative helicase MCM subunit Mcm2 (Cdc46/Mcm family)
VHPVLSYEQFQELEDWYAEDVRQLNDGDGDMPVPATVRVLAAAVKMSIAFARVHLRESVTQSDIERAKKLCKKLIKQHWDGEKFDATKNHSSQHTRRPAVYNLIAELEGQYDEGVPESHVVDTADGDTGSVLNDIEKLKQQGELYTPQKGHLRTT